MEKTKLAFAGKSLEVDLSAAKVHRAPGSSDFTLELPSETGSLVLDKPAIDALMRVIGRRNTQLQPAARWHGWRLSTLQGPWWTDSFIVGLGTWTAEDGTVFLVCERMGRGQRDGTHMYIHIVNLPMFLMMGGSIKPVSYLGTAPVMEGWLPDFVTHGPDLYLAHVAMRNLRGGAMLAVPAHDWAGLPFQDLRTREIVRHAHMPYAPEYAERRIRMAGACDVAQGFTAGTVATGALFQEAVQRWAIRPNRQEWQQEPVGDF